MAQLLPQLKKKKEWAKQTAQSLQSSSKSRATPKERNAHYMKQA